MSSAILSSYLLRTIQIVWLDLLLSGDNAVVIALACRRLPTKKRRTAIALGAGAAIVLRIAFAVLILRLLEIPYLKIVAAILLVWISVRLVRDASEKESVSSAVSVWQAVRIIAFADAVMSLDNVLAITAAAGGNAWLVVFGLLLSLPLVVFGASVFVRLLDRFHWLVWASVALLGWSAGQMAVEEPMIADRLGFLPSSPALWAGAAGALLVLAISFGFRCRGLSRA